MDCFSMEIYGISLFSLAGWTVLRRPSFPACLPFLIYFITQLKFPKFPTWGYWSCTLFEETLAKCVGNSENFNWEIKRIFTLFCAISPGLIFFISSFIHLKIHEQGLRVKNSKKNSKMYIPPGPETVKVNSQKRNLKNANNPFFHSDHFQTWVQFPLRSFLKAGDDKAAEQSI